MALWAIVFAAAVPAAAELPSPSLNTVFPPGAQAGSTVEVVADGTSLEGISGLRFSQPGITAAKGEGNRFTVFVPPETPPGVYDVRAVGVYGISSPRAFVVGNRGERLETEPNDRLEMPQEVPLDAVVNGRIEKPGDVDCYRFSASAGRRVVLECRAERIDSQVRCILELFDSQGNRLAANRGYAGVDPLIEFVAPADGDYLVKVFDLTYSGGAACFYRLEIDTGPRLEFSLPCVVERGKTAQLALFGRNLGPSAEAPLFDCIRVDVAAAAPATNGFHLRPAQLAIDAFRCDVPGGHMPLAIGLTDVPVVPGEAGHHSPGDPQTIEFPCEICGQLAGGDEQDWFAFQASRGDVLWLEGCGERIGSPVDLDLALLDETGARELLHLADCLDDRGGYGFPLQHLDPAGRWVAPADGRYLLMIRNLSGGLDEDPRRIYRLGIRREEPDFRLAVVSRRSGQPTALNVWRGGREMADVLVVRQRGMSAPIRVTASGLPAGVECPEIWIGPDADRAPLVFTAGRDVGPIAQLTITGQADLGGTEIERIARGGTMVWPGLSMPSGRLTGDIPLGAGPESPLLVTATMADEPAFQDGIVDVAVAIERKSAAAAPVRLSLVGLPAKAGRVFATIPPGESKGWLSIYWPASLAPGPYSWAVLAETEVPAADVTPGAAGNIAATFISNTVTVQVEPARIALEIDPSTPQTIGRGKIAQLGFTALRKHGFIGKIHTELRAPGGVAGLRARGVTLVGQTDSGSLQVIANDDAPLGRQPFLRLEAVGTVEDRPIYRAARFLELEITE